MQASAEERHRSKSLPAHECTCQVNAGGDRRAAPASHPQADNLPNLADAVVTSHITVIGDMPSGRLRQCMPSGRLRQCRTQGLQGSPVLVRMLQYDDPPASADRLRWHCCTEAHPRWTPATQMLTSTVDFSLQDGVMQKIVPVQQRLSTYPQAAQSRALRAASVPGRLKARPPSTSKSAKSMLTSSGAASAVASPDAMHRGGAAWSAKPEAKLKGNVRQSCDLLSDRPCLVVGLGTSSYKTGT